MKVVCAAPNCKYSSEHEDSRHITFLSFPNDHTAALWAHNCGRQDLMMKSSEELHLNYYVCSNHIKDKFFLSKVHPVIITQDAIPSLFGLQEPTTIGLDTLKPSYSPTEVMDSLELDNCHGSYQETTSAYQGGIYSSTMSHDNSSFNHPRSEEVEDRDDSTLNFESLHVNIDHSEAASIQFTNLCRICGQNATSAFDIFDDRGTKINIRQKIHLHLPILLENEDTMPRKLCPECHEKLEISHSLVITSLQTDIKLRKLLNLPNKYNYEDKFRSLISKYELEVTEDVLFNEIGTTSNVLTASSDCEVKNCEKTDTNSDEKENALKYVLHTDLNNLILQPLQFANDERGKTDLPSNPASTNTMLTNEHETNQINCLEINHEFQRQSNSKSTLSTTESISEVTCTVLNNKEENTSPQQSRVKVRLLELNRRCGHCSQAFFNRKELQLHMAENHSGQGMLFKCGACDKSYEKWSSLDVHEATHREDKPYLCDLCGKSFKHSNNLRGHKRVHLDISKKKRHVCETCGNAFRSRFHLREHMNQHDGTKPYVCEQCGKAFSKRIQLRQHRLSHGINKYACPICGVTFNRRGNMNTHLKRHSSNDGMYTCSVCECRCKSMSELKIHRKQHSETDILESIKRKSANKTVWQCKFCSRIFSKRALLSSHERTHNGDEAKIECEKCGKKLANKSSLRYHMKSIHTCERSHLCQYCGDAFVSKEARLIHERIHTGERPYSCKFCNMRYRCSSNLSQHMKAHSEVRPYICHYCSKSFTRKGALTIHERTHTGEKPFNCSICNRKFLQKSDLVKHSRVHESKIVNCEQCSETFATKAEIVKHLGCVHQLELQTSGNVDKYIELSDNFNNYSLTVSDSIQESNELGDIQYT